MISNLKFAGFSPRRLSLLASIAFLSPAAIMAQSNSNAYGFEDNTTTNWTPGSGSETMTANSNTAFLRTGIYSGKFTTTSTSSNRYAYNNSIYGASAPGTYIHFIYWALGIDAATSVDASLRYATANPPTGAGSIANASSGVPINASTWTRITYFSGNNSNRWYFPSPKKTSSNATTVYMDDIIVYTSTSNVTDIVKPEAPATLTGTVNASNVNLSWTSNTDAGTGVQATIVLRSTNTSATAPVLNDQAKYSVTGGSSGTDTLGGWTVISTTTGATATTYTDNALPAGNYIYAVVLRDLAYNYSVAAVSPIIVVPPPLAITIKDFEATNKGNYNQVSWNVTKASAYEKLSLERSTDGRNYAVLQEYLPEPGTAMYKDDNVAPKTYYRLSSTNLKGEITYSNTLLIATLNNKKAQLSPNPTGNTLFINFETKATGTVEIRNLIGNIALSASFADQNCVTMDVRNLAPGYYIANVQYGTMHYQTKFLKN